MNWGKPFDMTVTTHPLQDGCGVCGCRSRTTAYWDVNGMPASVMAALLGELNDQMGGETLIKNGGPLGLHQPGAWYTIIGELVCGCETALRRRAVDAVPTHPRGCAVCNYHVRDLRCLVDVGASDEALAGHLRALRAHCQLEVAE